MRGSGRSTLAAAALVLLGAAAPVGEPDRIRWLGVMRHIAVLAPATAGSGAPLLVVLGNPGRSARYALDSWSQLAEREGVIVAAISSADPDAWRSPADGPELLRQVVQRVASRHQIDRRRVYLFGARAGGGFALAMGALQPEYFAAVASFGGDLEPGALSIAGQLQRPLPVWLFVSKHDPYLGLEAMERTADTLRRSGAVVEVKELGASWRFERRGRAAAEQIWTGLKPYSLNGEPRYRPTRPGR